MLLLAASMYFYMYFKPIYILLVLYVVLVNFFAGKYIYKFKDSPAKKVILTVSIVLNLAVLVFFKYFNFLNFNITAMLDMLSFTNPIPALEIFLPLGISFYTFQAMAYTIDISRGIQEPEKNIGIFATFLMFYPQLVAGPIERAGHLLGQFREKHVYDYPRLVSGLRLMLWGLFKKVAIADRLGIFVKEIYVNMDQYSGLVLFIAAIFFAYQLYCDFSGYSDIAIGAARVMGFDLMLNFNRPYSARSVTDFWRRWHISLSTWLYDYVYNPVSFNRRYWGKAGIVYALMALFL
ncbi:MAG: MBOAT family protein [Cyclobacteriaceae bacterium]|nr:MBOAT family protein [Cyclobacteriaceae bacterium]